MTGPVLSERVGLAFERGLRRALRRPHVDLPLMLALLLLCGIGLVVLASASDGATRQVVAQSLRIALGLAALVVLARVPPAVLRVWTPWLYAASVLLLLLVPLVGSGRSARSWLDLGFFYVQPAELLKLTVPMMLAWYLNERPLPPGFATLAVCAALIGMPAALIAVQPDFGTAVLVAAAGAFVLFLAGLAWWRIGLVIAIIAAAAPLGWHFLRDYQRQRLLMFLDPEADRLGAGWNIIQSQIAIGSGGVAGKGYGMSTQAELDYLPEHTTDFIFAVFAEEFGALGVAVVIALYLYIIGRALWVASSARDTYGRLLAGSIALSFFVYVMVNGGMITGLLPVVGVPMPLISYGGTSAVSLLAGFGIVMSVHAHRRLVAP
jgi:rod shape determining protein RodA